MFATRTPHRPNAVGLSLCRLEEIEGSTIHFSSVDLIHVRPFSLSFEGHKPISCPGYHTYPVKSYFCFGFSREDFGSVSLEAV